MRSSAAASTRESSAAVPEVLTSGHHEAVRTWRLKEALRRTLIRRPELLSGRSLTKEESKLLAEVRAEEEESAAEREERGE